MFQACIQYIVSIFDQNAIGFNAVNTVITENIWIVQSHDLYYFTVDSKLSALPEVVPCPTTARE